METRSALVTFRVAVPVTAPLVAVTVVVPTANVVASPFVPAALLIVATLVSLDVQPTVVVISCVLPSV